MKLKGEVGMGGLKSLLTRFVGIIMSTTCLLFSIIAIVPVDNDSLVLSLANQEKLMLSPIAIIMARYVGLGD